MTVTTAWINQLVRLSITRLRKEERQVLNLIYDQGFTHFEAAEALSIPVGTVKTRLTMAVRKLRNYYQHGLAKAG